MEKLYVNLITSVKDVGVCRSSSEWSSLLLNAKKAKEEEEEAALKAKEEEAAAAEEKALKAASESYNSKAHFAAACDSIMADFLFGDGKVSSEDADSAKKAKEECLALEGCCAESLFGKFPVVLKRIKEIFGEAPNGLD